jgi:hypothetical protein
MDSRTREAAVAGVDEAEFAPVCGCGVTAARVWHPGGVIRLYAVCLSLYHELAGGQRCVENGR